MCFQIKKKLLKELNNYIKKNNLKIDILSRFNVKNLKKKKNLFKIFTKNRLNLIQNNPKNFNKFNIIDRYNLVVGFDSTLMLETLGGDKSTNN